MAQAQTLWVVKNGVVVPQLVIKRNPIGFAPPKGN